MRLRARATVSTRHDGDLRDELELHIRLLAEEYAEQGMPPELARQRAHRDFGNPARFQEDSHELFSFRLIDALLQDLRYAVREMRRSPLFTAVAVLSLALGIGAVTSAFAIADAFLLRGLPVRDPGHLVAFSIAGNDGWARWPYAVFARWRTSPDRLFEAAAASDPMQVEGRGAERGRLPTLRISLVSSNYFEVVGSDVALGRPPTDAENDRSGPAVAVISDALWHRAFGAGPDVLTRTIDVAGVSCAIVGVARRGFTGHVVGHPTDVWVPLALQPALMHGPSLLDAGVPNAARWLTVLGRVQDGVPVGRAAAAADLIQQRVLAAQPDGGKPDAARESRQQVSLRTASTGYAPERGEFARPLALVASVTLLVLLVACANFANLMLARAAARQREIVIRLALGGGRWRLVREAAMECLGLALVAGLLGGLFAGWLAVVAVRQFAVMIVPIELALALDGRIACCLAAAVALAFGSGLWPIVRTARSVAIASIARSASGGQTRTRRAGGRLMLVAQLTICTVLLVGAGLLLRTVVNLRSQDLGFDRHVLMIPIAGLGRGAAPSAAPIAELRATLSALPGVKAVGVSGPPLLNRDTYWIDGSQTLTTDRGTALPGVRWTFADVGPGFFEALGMVLVDGRTFGDGHAAGDGVVINQSLARFLFAGERAVGRRLRMGPRAPLLTVIGVVNDVKQTSPRDRGLGVVYRPMRDFDRVVLAVRTDGPPAPFVPSIRRALASIAPGAALEDVRTVAEVLDDAIAQERWLSALTLCLAALVVAIGCVGLYALISFDVAERTRELGIRVALGATRPAILRLILEDLGRVVLPGLAAGIPLGILASQALARQLYGVGPADPQTLAAVAAVLTAVSLLAVLRPARTAVRVDPLLLLRDQ